MTQKKVKPRGRKVKVTATPTKHSASRRNRAFLISNGILIVVFLIVYPYIFDAKLDLNGDNYEYLNYASSIVQGHGYASPYSTDFVPTNWFPPGYSAILAVFMLFVGKNTVLLKILNGLFFLGSILLLHRLISKKTDMVVLSFGVSLLLLLNSGLLRLSTILMSEMPFLFFSVLAMYCAAKLDDDTKFYRSKYFYGAILGAVLSFYMRTVGIVVIGAVLMHWAMQRRWKLAGYYMCGVVLLYLPWIIRNSIQGLEGRYMGAVMAVNPWRPEEGQIGSVGEFWDKMMTNLYDTVIRGFPETIFAFSDFNNSPKSTIVLFGILVLALTLFGAWKFTKLRYLFLFFILGNIGLFLLWHGGNGVRYVWPILPVVAFCFFNGLISSIQWIIQKLKYRSPAYVPFLILILAPFYIPKLSDLNKMAKQAISPAYANYFEIAKRVNAMNDNDILVVCRKPGMFYWHSGTQVMNYKYTQDAKELLTDFVERKVDFVVIDQLGYSSTPRYLIPAINNNMDLFKVVQQIPNPDTYLMQFDLEAARRKFGL